MPWPPPVLRRPASARPLNRPSTRLSGEQPPPLRMELPKGIAALTCPMRCPRAEMFHRDSANGQSWPEAARSLPGAASGEADIGRHSTLRRPIAFCEYRRTEPNIDDPKRAASTNNDQGAVPSWIGCTAQAAQPRVPLHSPHATDAHGEGGGKRRASCPLPRKTASTSDTTQFSISPSRPSQGRAREASFACRPSPKSR
jgi:hypothetical protein